MVRPAPRSSAPLDRIVFFGTPDFAVPTLEALASAGRMPVLVVTQPDRRAGRGRKLQPPPVAARARELGLVNRVAPDDQLGAETQKLAETVAAKLATAVRIGKEAFYAQAQLPLDEAYRYTGDVMVANMLDRDTEEGIQAFLEKRDPAWSQD